MSENSENKETKISGLRPPSKIPSMGVSRLPSSSSIKLDGLHFSTVSKLGGGSAAKKTADMPFGSKHNDFHKKTSDERKSSSGSDSFMADARRLSEAGVRRSSGNSVVLTEDTDKFIIGNRIWVGGTKPGHIAYIGETNFGNGEWAGVVLDEPIGKNDGSVSGTRYFQCEPKKGIFARLTNLTSAPLSSVEDSMIQSSFAATKPLGFSTPMPKRQASNVSTVTSTVTKTAVKSVNQHPIPKSNNELKIGDRVIISSGQGSKLGYLRYRGATQFAPGEWCGIELDDPLGKNNGIVDGVRYFDCGDKFGLFTPVGKVSKSPMSASRMSTNCAIHKTKRSPDSMNGSMISSITTNTKSSIPSRQTKVSDLDRLKLQLTQMKNENELLRSQVTKAANQADVAEKRLEETLKAQVDRPLENQVNSLLVLQNQLDDFKKLVDDEKEKIQNLQFTNEEQNVVNIELQNKNSELLIKIKELESDLDKERNLSKDVENEKMKMFEKEEELCRVREELESLKKLIDNNEDELQKSVSNLSSEVVDKEVVLNTLRHTLNENSQTHDRLLKEANEKLCTTREQLNKVIEEKDKIIERNKEMIDQLNEGIKCLSALKNEEHDNIVNNLKNELSKLKDECKNIIDKKAQDAKIDLENHVQIENDLKQEIKNLLENKNHEIECLQKEYTDLMSLNSSEKDSIEKLKIQLHSTTEDLKALKEKNLVYTKEALEAALKQQIQSTSIQVEGLMKQFDNTLSFKNEQINSCNITLKQIKEQLIQSKSFQKTYNSKIKEKEEEINTLSEKYNTVTNDFEQLEKINQNISTKLKEALKVAQDKIIQVTDLEKKLNDLESQQDLTRNELEIELTTKIKSISDELVHLKLEKSTLEEEHENYVKKTENTTKDMDSKLKQSDILIDNLNKSLKESTLSKQNELDSISKQVLHLEEEREQLLKHHNSELSIKEELINTLSNKLEQTLTEKQKQDLSNANLQTELTNEATNYQTVIKDLQNKISELEEKLSSNNKVFKQELELLNSEKELTRSENLNLLDNLKSLKNIKSNLEEKLVSNEECKQDIQNLNETIVEKKKIIDDSQIKIKQLDDLIVQTKTEYEVKLKEKENEILKLTKIGEDNMKMEKLSLEEKTKVMLNEKDKENLILHKQIKDLEDMKTSYEKRLEESESQKQDMKKLNEIIDEKIKTIEDNKLKIEQLSNLVSLTKTELEANIQVKENKIQELAKAGEEKLNVLKQQLEKQNKTILDEKNTENSNLLDKINILENMKISLEKQLDTNKMEENIMMSELKKSIEEKTKIIIDNNLKVEQLNSLIVKSKEEFSANLKEKEDKIMEILKTNEEKLTNDKLVLENTIKIQLDEKDKEITHLLDKLSISKTQEHEITELKKMIEEKTQVIEDNNSRIELLNSLIAQTKEDFNVILKEKENEIDKLLQSGEEKLNAEMMTFDKQIKMCVEQKDSEIELLKTQLQEFIENNTEKELMLKLESVVNELEKEKTRTSSLEILKSELDKTMLEHKTKLDLLEITKADMTKANKEQQDLNAKLTEKIKTDAEQINIEKLQIQKEIDQLKIKCSELQSTLDEKNLEILNLKSQTSEKLKDSDSNNEELNRLKVLLEKDHNAFSHLEFRIQELTDENHHLNEQIEGNSNLLQKNNMAIKEKYDIEKKYEETYSMLKIKENQILVLQTELNSWKLKDMGKSNNNNAQEKINKTEAHLLAEKNEEIKMLNSIILGLHKKLSAVMETDVSDFELEKNPNGVSKEDYQKLYKTAKNNVKLKECENFSLKQEICKLKTENDRNSEFKTKCESLEHDKKRLEKLIVIHESSQTDQVKSEQNDSKSETTKILEEKDWQINLLNNIIAGLHTKVSDNKFKIEALEKQILDSGVDQNKKIHLRTTRLYCERCEVFDSHDTEDCPEKPESPKVQKRRRVVDDNLNASFEEPFCVCCDMFGHTANECDSSLTF